MAFQFFISYAHNDNVPPIEGEGKGFVSTLVIYLEHYFKLWGMPRPTVWRDKGVLRDSDQFDQIIQQGLADSDVLLVIHSNNWRHSDYCKKELTLFREQRPKLSIDQVKKRIICVEQRFLPFDTRPELLSGESGYRFYEEDEEFRGRYVEFFELGAKEQSKKFARVAKELADDLWQRAQAQEQISPAPQPQKKNGAVRPSSKRTVYLAKPAKDLRWAYERLYDELTGNNFNVVPARDEKIPSDDVSAATAFIEKALAQSERSVHVIGEKGGPVIDEEDTGLALQLRLAREQLATRPTFGRIVWAPEILRDESGAALNEGRDAIATLRRFDEMCETDKVRSTELSAFVEFLIDHLFNTKPQIAGKTSGLAKGSHVYIKADVIDADYAMEVADSLDQRNVRWTLPLWNDEERRDEHEREQLAKCDSVIIPWQSKGKSWVESISQSFADWRAHGREQEFDMRSVVEGWPPNADKKAFKRFPPREAIDFVLDLTDCSEPPLPPEKFEPLFEKGSE